MTDCEAIIAAARKVIEMWGWIAEMAPTDWAPGIPSMDRAIGELRKVLPIGDDGE